MNVDNVFGEASRVLHSYMMFMYCLAWKGARDRIENRIKSARKKSAKNT